jgi:hypothetical protein
MSMVELDERALEAARRTAERRGTGLVAERRRGPGRRGRPCGACPRPLGPTDRRHQRLLPTGRLTAERQTTIGELVAGAAATLSDVERSA